MKFKPFKTWNIVPHPGKCDNCKTDNNVHAVTQNQVSVDLKKPAGKRHSTEKTPAGEFCGGCVVAAVTA
jgi:hypothetical protein